MPTAAPKSKRPRGLADEIGKVHDFEQVEHEAYLDLIRTHDILAAGHAEKFARHGLSSPLFNILSILRGHERREGPGHEGVPVYTVGREMLTREPDISRLADRLEKLGLVSRHRCSEDRRVVRLRLTDEGRRVQEEAARESMDLIRRQFEHLGQTKSRQLSRLLCELRNPPAADVD
ncbi:MAG: MarR family transcriptional regulator [Planctomycetota bacterium]